MFIAALFRIAWTLKQPKCPSTDEWIKKLWYICTIEYYSAVKRNCISDSFIDYHGYSIYSKRFLPTVVDIMVI